SRLDRRQERRGGSTARHQVQAPRQSAAHIRDRDLMPRSRAGEVSGQDLRQPVVVLESEHTVQGWPPQVSVYEKDTLPRADQRERQTDGHGCLSLLGLRAGEQETLEWPSPVLKV